MEQDAVIIDMGATSDYSDGWKTLLCKLSLGPVDH